MPLPIHEPLMVRHILLLGNLMSFCGEAADVFCISMVNLPRCTQDNNKGSQRPAELRVHILNSLSYCTLGGVTQHDVHPDTPCRGFWDWQRLGLLAKGMTHGMTKLLCMSVRLGLYPTDICWLRLIQTPEKPGIRVRNRWPFFPLPPLCNSVLHKKKYFKSSSCFLQTLKYNCLCKKTVALLTLQ